MQPRLQHQQSGLPYFSWDAADSHEQHFAARICSDRMATHGRRGPGSSPGRVDFATTVGIPLLGDCCAALVHHRHTTAAGLLPSGWPSLRLGCALLLLQAGVCLTYVLLSLNCAHEQGVQGRSVKAIHEIVIFQASSSGRWHAKNQGNRPISCKIFFAGRCPAPRQGYRPGPE